MQQCSPETETCKETNSITRKERKRGEIKKPIEQQNRNQSKQSKHMPYRIASSSSSSAQAEYLAATSLSSPLGRPLGNVQMVIRAQMLDQMVPTGETVAILPRAFCHRTVLKHWEVHTGLVTFQISGTGECPAACAREGFGFWRWLRWG